MTLFTLLRITQLTERTQRGSTLSCLRLLRRCLLPGESVFSPSFPHGRIYALVCNAQEVTKALRTNYLPLRSTEVWLLNESERTSVLNQFHSRVDSTDAFQPSAWINVNFADGRNCLSYVLQRKHDKSMNVLALLKHSVDEHIKDSQPVSGKSHAQGISRLLTPNQNEPLSSRLPFNTQVLKLYGIELLHLNAGNDLALADPSIEDIEPFIHAGVEVSATVNRMLIQIDDRIQIIKGPFTGTYATVKEAQSSGIVANLLIADSDSCSTIIRFRHFKRVFESGQELTVIVGLRSGSRGIVASSSQATVTLLLDDCKTQVESVACLFHNFLNLRPTRLKYHTLLLRLVEIRIRLNQPAYIPC